MRAFHWKEWTNNFFVLMKPLQNIAVEKYNLIKSFFD